MRAYKKLIVSSILVFSLILGCFFKSNSVSVGALPSEQTEEEYSLIASSENLKMFANLENGLFYIENLSDGSKWYSVPENFYNIKISDSIYANAYSQLVIDFVYSENLQTATEFESANSYYECFLNEGISVDKLSDGIKVTYDFVDLEIQIPVSYVLEKGTFKAIIEYSKIKEGKTAKLINISLLPSFLSGTANESGYLVIPDGCGAIVNFNNGVKAKYEKQIYGEEPDTEVITKAYEGKNISMPFFGAVKNNSALLAIIEKSAECSAVCASTVNESSALNSVNSKIYYRKNSQAKMFEDTFAYRVTVNKWIKYAYDKTYTARYEFLSGADAGYIGIAKAYRDYLFKSGDLKKNASNPKFNLDIYNSVRETATFLGFSYSRNKTLTTFEETEKIISDLKEKGVKDIELRLLGWNKNGLTNSSLSVSAKTNKKAGSLKQLEALETFAQENGVSISKNVDFTFHKKGSGKSIKTAFNKYISVYDFLPSVYTKIEDTKLNIAKSSATKELALKYLKKIKDDDSGVSISALGNFCYTDFSNNASVTRGEHIKIAQSVLSEYKKSGKKITLDCANAYAFKYADRIINVPVSSSACKLFDSDVPLYQTVLQGYVNLTGESVMNSDDYRLNYLNCVANGYELKFSGIYASDTELQNTEIKNFYSCNYKRWIDDAAKMYEEYMPIVNSVYNQRVADYSENNDVIKTVYENGTTVIVNMSENESSDFGVTVPAFSCKLLKG